MNPFGVTANLLADIAPQWPLATGGGAMDIFYLICAVVGGTVIVCQFLMTLLGMGGDHGADAGGHDAGHVGGHDGGDAGHDGHDVGHGQESSWFAGMLTFRTLTAAVAFFGLAGMAAQPHLNEAAALAIALAGGACALFLVAWLMNKLGRLNADGTLHIDRAVGATGTVYLTIPASRAGAGRVMVTVHQRTVEYKAITSQQALPTGVKIRVVGIASADTVEVAAVEEAASATTTMQV